MTTDILHTAGLNVPAPGKRVSRMRFSVSAFMALLLCVFLLASCRSSKDTVKDDLASRVPECVTAKMKYNITTGQHKVSLSGSLRMKKGKVVRLQLVFMGLMEVARLELTPDYFIAIDRMNKQYAKATYDEVEFVKRTGHDFKSLQRLMQMAVIAEDGKATIASSGGGVVVEMTVSDVKEDCDWDTYTELSKRYEQVSPNAILEKLSRM